MDKVRRAAHTQALKNLILVTRHRLAAKFKAIRNLFCGKALGVKKQYLKLAARQGMVP